jgi:hypothetical protein
MKTSSKGMCRKVRSTPAMETEMSMIENGNCCLLRKLKKRSKIVPVGEQKGLPIIHDDELEIPLRNLISPNRN